MAQLNVEPRTVILGDNLKVTRSINSASVDLIATDPPFNSKKEYAAPIGTEAEGGDFTDIWTWDDVDELRYAELVARYPEIKHVINAIGVTHGSGSAAYAVMMGTRIFEFHRVLKPTGTLYLHCNQDANFMLRILLDFVFGAKNFRNEIVWSYSGGGMPKRDFGRKHDTIFRYTKSDKFVFNKQYRPYAASCSGRHSDGTPVDWERGAGMTAVWADISPVNTQAKERTGYRTQKPIPLYERIIAASSNEGDVVFDPFCGCGTTLLAAEKLNRQWLGIDVGGKATKLIAKGLDRESEQGTLGHNGVPPLTRRIIFKKTPFHRTDFDEPLDGRAILQQAAATNW